ncbi:fumarylacetoacetate hydrolase family protein [Caballeronia sp. KNU42]
MEFVVPFAPACTLQVADHVEVFPVNRVFCVGRNYAAHAREMGKEPNEPPFFFMKPVNAVVPAGGTEITIPYPPKTSNFQHEIELVIAIGKGGSNIPVNEALNHVYGYAVGLDMTRRDLQLEARDKGRPWEFGKSFSKSAPIGPLRMIGELGVFDTAKITLTVNEQPRQASDISNLVWSVAECIAYLSEYDALEPGDLIMTGTPEGVNAVQRGDVMRGGIDRLGEIVVRVGS